MSAEEEDRVKQGNYDRSWNDPPVFNYDPNTAAAASSSSAANKLKKRVGYPAGAEAGAR